MTEIIRKEFQWTLWIDLKAAFDCVDRYFISRQHLSHAVL